MAMAWWPLLATLMGLLLGLCLHPVLMRAMLPLCPPLIWYDQQFSPFPRGMALGCGLAAIALLLSGFLPPGVSWLCWLGFCALSLALALIDRASLLLPDRLTQPLLWLGLLWHLLCDVPRLPEAVWGVVAGYLILWLVSGLFGLLRGVDGLGGGDVKLLAALGAWCGWQSLPVLLMLASLLALGEGIGRRVIQGIPLSMPLPFGPPLLLAGLWLILPQGIPVLS